ncbi:MAG: hypothetical protein IJ328_02525 [Muribaculaceae bacterium]|nr:hypothetical protein [Muribaculaceae bacterium]
MAKRIIYFLLMATLGFQLKAGVGDWQIHGVFGNKVVKIIDAETKVYSLVNGWLYCYDKEAQETESLSESGDLNGVDIASIYYDYESKRLFIVYSDSNIDILDRAGNVINIPDIYNASINSSKSINDVAFSEYGTYIATDFGYVLLNDAKNEVKESRIYNTAVQSICAVGEKLIMSANNQLYLEEIGKHYGSLNETISASFKQSGKLYRISDTKFLLDTGWLYLFEVVGEDVAWRNTLSQIGVKSIQPVKTGFQYMDNDGNLNRLDENGVNTSIIKLPESMHGSCLSSFESDGSLWELNEKGFRHVAVSDTGVETVMMDFVRPNASTVDIPYNLVYNTVQEKLYVMNCGANRYFSDYLRRGAISTYDGISWEDVIPESVSTKNEYGQNNGHINAPYSLVFDPEDADTYYVGTWFEGVYKITGGKVVAKYDWTNSPIEKIEVAATFHTCTAPCIQFDKNLNLWVSQSGNKNIQFSVLPRAKQALENISREDWLTPNVAGVTENYTGHFLITSRDVKLHNNGGLWEPLVIFYDDGNPASSNIKSKVFSSLTDQDGKDFSWNYINCFAEDKNGRVWMGTNIGVVELIPHNAFSTDNFTINHIKVPRNDGTNLADYLLDNTDVTCIEVDGSNRKWIGTSSSGVLLVSEDGSEIIEQFTAENSPMLSNKVLSVKCNPLNNKVYIGTDKGLMEYTSDSEPAAESYSDIYAYPNPVRPEFTGNITIRGLMENSLVKIADSEGNVVKSIRSTGGMTTWDGCNSQGEPVKSGVYFVFASQNENETSSGAVTKILIIR